MQEFIVVFNETDVIGYDDESELQEALYSYIEQERKEKAEEYGYDIDYLDSEEAKEIDMIPGDEAKIYKTKDVIAALKNNSTLDDEDKESLLKELKRDKIEFKVDSVFSEVIEEVEEFHF
jgi:tyrosine-protein phosphatase YwqE